MKTVTRTVYRLERIDGDPAWAYVEAEYSGVNLELRRQGRTIVLDPNQQRELLYVLKGVEA